MVRIVAEDKGKGVDGWSRFTVYYFLFCVWKIQRSKFTMLESAILRLYRHERSGILAWPTGLGRPGKGNCDEIMVVSSGFDSDVRCGLRVSGM